MDLNKLFASGGLAPVNSATSNDPAVYANLDWMNAGSSGRSTGNLLGANTTYNPASTPSYNQDDLAYLDDQRSTYERLLGSADNTLNSGLTRLNDSYTAETNKANTGRSRALEDFATQRQDSQRGKEQAINKVDTNARTLRDSLARIIGMASGGGSSAFQYAMPNAVARQASQQRSGVMTNFGENERNLVTSENRAKEDFDSLLQELVSQRQSREEELRAGVMQQKQGIFDRLANIAGERARLTGGGYGAARVAQQPYRDQYNTLQSQIEGLPNQFRTQVDSREIKVNPVSLRDYVVDRQAINANQQSGQQQYSPYANFLRNKDEERAF